jgi:hypothetical protein
VRSTPPGGGLGRRKPPPRKIAREAMLEESKKGVSHDLFDAPPPSGSGLVDLSDMAHSEPPESLASNAPAPETPSSAPPLDLLAHGEGVELHRSEEDVDFLLGLTGNPATTAALASPTLADLARKAPSDPPPSRPMPRESESTQPAARVYVPKKPENEPAEGKKRGGLGWVLIAGALGAGVIAFALNARKSETQGERVAAGVATQVSEPTRPPAAEPSPTAASEPSPSPKAASGEVASAHPSASSAPLAAAPAHAVPTPGAKEKPNNSAKPTREESSESGSATASTEPKMPSLPKPPVAAPGTSFDRGAAASALASAAAQASACRKEGDPSGVANVTLTFAPSGRVTAAKLSGPPFAGTATGGCIASTLRRAKVPPFDGDLVTVSKTIVVQ